MKPYYRDKARALFHGDNREVLPQLPSNSVDLVATDPPYGISFMGKSWDKALPDKAIWEECLRVLKPGGFAFVMCIPRADCLSRMIISLEDAGFLVNFTPIFWAYASGFPKAQNIGKAVDKRNAKTWLEQREVAKYVRLQMIEIGINKETLNKQFNSVAKANHWTALDANNFCMPILSDYVKLKSILNLDNRFDELIEREEAEREVVSRQPMTIGIGGNSPRMGSEKIIDLPATPQAKALDGSYGGFQPKPAVEVIIVAMKPLSEKTFVDQALKNGKGVTWLDDCRVPTNWSEEYPESWLRSGRQLAPDNWQGASNKKEGSTCADRVNPKGRFPANLLVSDDVLNDGKVTSNSRPRGITSNSSKGWEGRYASGIISSNPTDSGSFSRYFDLDKWAQTLPFLIVPKASKGEKNKGCEELPQQSNMRVNEEAKFRTKMGNNHPTVKPLKLMSYLITLGSREGDWVLDPFVGSGTTLVAAQQMGRKGLGIEANEDYCQIAAKRCQQTEVGALDENSIPLIRGYE